VESLSCVMVSGNAQSEAASVWSISGQIVAAAGGQGMEAAANRRRRGVQLATVAEGGAGVLAAESA
jgi:hypothetical protein